MEKITCYLDSLDYSTLTDPRKDSQEILKIKNALKHLASSKQVRFVYSQTIISESVSLSAATSHLAELRAELLHDLCGSNALISHDRLAKAELDALSRRSSPPDNILDAHGQWFSDSWREEKPDLPWDRMRQITEEMMQAQGLDRNQRRAKLRTLFKDGKPCAALKEFWKNRGVEAFAAELKSIYPMRSEDAEALIKYAFGEAPKKNFDEALWNSLLDVRYMMMWFTANQSLANPISEIVRRPGREIGQIMRELVETASRGTTLLRDSGNEDGPSSIEGRIKSFWEEKVEKQLLTIIMSKVDPDRMQVYDLEPHAINHHCPGLSTAVRATFSSLWSNVGEGRKELPSNSQPVDIMHSIYAPYVDVFRTDRFMTPHIQRQVTRCGTVVVPVLSQLLATLDERLA